MFYKYYFYHANLDTGVLAGNSSGIVRIRLWSNPQKAMGSILRDLAKELKINPADIEFTRFERIR